MAGSLNKVTLIGRLGQDPEVRSTQAGDKIVSFSVATSDQWKDKQSGERKERVEWHKVVVFNTQVADIAERFLLKGSMVHVEGALATRKWTDQSGTDRYTTEIVLARYRGELTLLGDARNGDEGRSQPPRRQPSHAEAAAGSGGGVGGGMGGGFGGGDLDDEIPFAPCWQ